MDFKKIIPHGIAALIFVIVSCIFFAPNAFKGKVLAQSDNDKARGMQAEIRHYLDSTGTAPLWTNAAFGGMPSYQIYMKTPGNLAKHVLDSLFLFQPYTSVWAYFFASMLCMYLLLMVLKVDWRIGIFGALAYTITSYNVDILGAGHSTKMAALSLAPGLLAAAALIFNRRYWLGGGLLALFVAMQIAANHVQITYYTFIIIGFLALVQFIWAFRHKTFGLYGKSLAVLVAASAIGVLANYSRLATTFEYGQETIRGKSELSAKAGKGDGLDKDYAFGWSYGVGESLTLLVPHFAGGGSGESFRNTELFKRVSPTLMGQYTKQGMSAENAKKMADQRIGGLFYTGSQPGVGTAIYFGAIVCFLFLLGAFLVRNEDKWWMLSAGIFMLTIAWGKNFFLNDIWYSYVPMFNKFRAVSMAMGLGQLCFAALAALGLQKMFDPDISKADKTKALWLALGGTVLFSLLAMALHSSTGPNDGVLQGQTELLEALKKDRSSMLRSDLLRSLLFVALGALPLFLYLNGKLKSTMTVALVALFALTDHWLVCTRSLTSDDYTDKKEELAPPVEYDYDKKINEDKDIQYRVLDLYRGSITGNSASAYYHKSLSGYHAAKIQRYQEVVDKYLGDSLSKSMHILGMLNTKYIVTGDQQVIPNAAACGHAWFVKSFDFVETGDAELNALAKLNPKEKAVIQKSNAPYLNGLQITPDSAAYIKMTAYNPDKMQYEYSAATDQLALFPEIYYPPAKGWQCYIDGQQVDGFIKADYLIRAMRVPAGKHTLEMRFHPQSYYMGEKIAYGASALAILGFILGMVFFFKNHSVEDPARLEEMPEEAPRSTAVTERKTPPQPIKKGKK